MFYFSGQTPCDIALSPQIKQVLGVTPIRTLRLLPARFEGAINKVRIGWLISPDLIFLISFTLTEVKKKVSVMTW